MSRRAAIVLALASLAACGSPAREEEPRPSPESAGPLRRGAELLAADRPREALVELDEALAGDPSNARAWVFHGRAFLRMARADGESAMVYADALSDFEKAIDLGAGAEALAGAARAAHMSLEPEKALAYAKRAIQARGAEALPGELDPERTRIEASFALYVAAKQSGSDPSSAFAETMGFLDERLARAPGDVWAWTQLANLCEWEGRPHDAAAALENALDAAPADEALHARFAALTRAAGGREAVLAAYDRFADEHPYPALADWFRAVEHFAHALEQLGARQDAAPAFYRAEERFAACRAREPGYESSCKGYEVMCRCGVGWSRYFQGDLPGAKQAFLSMEEAVPLGLEWELKGQLLSGVRGLQGIAGARLPEDLERATPAETEPAAEIYDFLRAYDEGDADFANNSGFFHREAGVALEFQAREKLAEAAQEADDARGVELEREGLALRARAREHIEKSLAGYREAIRRAPEDVRFHNDCALIIVYHAQGEAEEGERILLRAVELGQGQLEGAELSDEARDQLLEAWGDAHQNLGLLYLTVRKDPTGARGWLEKSFAIGPRPRVDRAWIQDVALPACDRLAAGERVDFVKDVDPRLWPVE